MLCVVSDRPKHSAIALTVEFREFFALPFPLQRALDEAWSVSRTREGQAAAEASQSVTVSTSKPPIPIARSRSQRKQIVVAESMSESAP